MDTVFTIGGVAAVLGVVGGIIGFYKAHVRPIWAWREKMEGRVSLIEQCMDNQAADLSYTQIRKTLYG